MPTIINWLIKKGVTIPSRIEGKSYGRDIINALQYQKIHPDSIGWSLEEIIRNRFDLDISHFDRIIVFVIDGLSYRSFKHVGARLMEDLKPEILIGSTVFPSMTTTAFTSLFTGVFPRVHRLFCDKFYDIASNEPIYIKRNSCVGSYKFPLAFTLIEYMIFCESDIDIKISVISAGVSHTDKEGQSFLKRFICDIYEVNGVNIGEFIECNTNYDAFETIIRLLGRYNKANIRHFVLIVRFSIDWIVHKYGVDDFRTINELEKILEYIILISYKIKSIWNDNRTLIFLLSDHGHKDIDYGLVSYKDEIEPMLSNELKSSRFVATNQTVLSFYNDSFRWYTLKYGCSLATILRKDGKKIYAYDLESKRWHKVETIDPNELPTIRLSYEKYKISEYIGEYLLLADNFYFGYYSKNIYATKCPNYVSLKSAHGGLSQNVAKKASLFRAGMS